MNASTLDDHVQRWPTLRSREWLVSFLERAAKDRNVVAAIAVGSSVRPNVASEDLDLVVLCQDVKLMCEKAPIEVDLRKVCADEAEEKIKAGHDLLSWAVRFGQPLLDKKRAWDGIRRRWKDRVQVPSVEVAGQRANKLSRRIKEMREAGDADACADLEVSYHTHLARARLAKDGIFPASRPELPAQLRELGESALASDLERALAARAARRQV